MSWTGGRSSIFEVTRSPHTHELDQFTRYLGGILTMSEGKRKMKMANGDLKDVTGHKPLRFATYFGLALLVCMIIVAWVLFIMLSI